MAQNKFIFSFVLLALILCRGSEILLRSPRTYVRPACMRTYQVQSMSLGKDVWSRKSTGYLWHVRHSLKFNRGASMIAANYRWQLGEASQLSARCHAFIMAALPTKQPVFGLFSLCLEELLKRAVVLGAGYTAVEFASIWRGMTRERLSSRPAVTPTRWQLDRGFVYA